MKPFVQLIILALGILPFAANAQTKPAVKAPVKKKTVVKKSAAAAKDGATYQYYTNKKVSVKTGPWANSEQQIWLYDLKGNVTYTFTNSRLHGVTRTEFTFHPNGAVSNAITTTHPDGGIKGYRTTTTFSEENEPQWRQSEESPMTKLEMPDKYYWDKTTKQWKKQEIVEESPVRVKD